MPVNTGPPAREARADDGDRTRALSLGSPSTFPLAVQLPGASAPAGSGEDVPALLRQRSPLLSADCLERPAESTRSSEAWLIRVREPTGDA